MASSLETLVPSVVSISVFGSSFWSSSNVRLVARIVSATRAVIEISNETV